MLKIVAAGVTALFVTASPLAYAQTAATAATRSTADLGTLTDMRINVVKAALQLTPDQEKYWPAIEDAIRARVENRQARIADAKKLVDKVRDGNSVEVLRNRDTVDFLNGVPMPWRNDQPTSRNSLVRGSRSIRPSAPTRSSAWPSLRFMYFVRGGMPWNSGLKTTKKIEAATVSTDLIGAIAKFACVKKLTIKKLMVDCA